jgi:hypothetical protein
MRHTFGGLFGIEREANVTAGSAAAGAALVVAGSVIVWATFRTSYVETTTKRFKSIMAVDEVWDPEKVLPWTGLVRWISATVGAGWVVLGVLVLAGVLKW